MYRPMEIGIPLFLTLFSFSPAQLYKSVQIHALFVKLRWRERKSEGEEANSYFHRSYAALNKSAKNNKLTFKLCIGETMLSKQVARSVLSHLFSIRSKETIFELLFKNHQRSHQRMAAVKDRFLFQQAIPVSLMTEDPQARKAYKCNTLKYSYKVMLKIQAS